MTDLRYALRQLAKSPGFTAVAVLTLALGIGANSAVFGLINGLLVKPLPYQDSSRLVLLWEQFPSQGLERIPVSAPEYLDYEKQTHSLERIAAFDNDGTLWSEQPIYVQFAFMLDQLETAAPSQRTPMITAS